MSDEEFARRYESYDAASAAAYLAEFAATRKELMDGIEFLIQERERRRDAELGRLEADAAVLLLKLKTLDFEKMLQELACFRDTLALQQAAIERGEAARQRDERAPEE